MTEPRLQKYAGPSGSGDAVHVAGAGREAERLVVLVALLREVHLAGERLERGGERPCGR